MLLERKENKLNTLRSNLSLISISKRTLAVLLCGSFAFSFTACKKKNYKEDIDKFVDEVGSSLGGSDYVFESLEDASEKFYDTTDLDEERPQKEWAAKDFRSDYFTDMECMEGFFYKGQYSELWDQLEEAYHNEETSLDASNKIRAEYLANPKNPTLEHMVARLEDSGFGMATRTIELMRLYETDDAVYYSNSFYSSKHPNAFCGMRVVFDSKSDAKDYWAKLVDMDDAYLATQSQPYDEKTGEVKALFQNRLDAWHDIDEENYMYYDKRNEGYLTLYLSYEYSYSTASPKPFEKELFSIQISGREVTMLSCHIREQDYDIEQLREVYDSLGLNNPLDTEMHGIDESFSEKERREYVKNPDQLLYFLLSYPSSTYASGPVFGVGVCTYSLVTSNCLYMLPTVRFMDHAAWVPYVYDDPADYLSYLDE